MTVPVYQGNTHPNEISFDELIDKLFSSLSANLSDYAVQKIFYLIQQHIRNIGTATSPEKQLQEEDIFYRKINIIIAREHHPYKALLLDCIIFATIILSSLTIGFMCGAFLAPSVGVLPFMIVAGVLGCLANGKTNEKVSSFFFTESYFKSKVFLKNEKEPITDDICDYQ
ncbi:hypothetical protein OQJ26_14540 [Legionella sp. PATHC038]|uniref:hypothetical protein n=1 Tax=Legionella sheltonii TaxID=2992041 RepID=UPI0022444D52|nr:hypothetical protein [Legionella sp. PATHC038]MCW8399999.1 hypothetical protein [Legionella sp. PATHC038]